MTDAPGPTLVERVFEVGVPAAAAWDALSRVERWPDWAPHIQAARIEPSGALTAGTSGTFRFRPVGRSRFAMTAFDPPRAWTWSGKALGVDIDYEHRFEPLGPDRARLIWTVRATRAPAGLRARAFARIYARLVDRAWPRFKRAVEA